MSREPLYEVLSKWYYANRRPVKIGIVNTGGTFTSIPKKIEDQILLEPAQSEEEVRSLVFATLGLNHFISMRLLEVNFKHIFGKDSSQIIDYHRKDILEALISMYHDVDGMIIIHGTDTTTKTAQYLSMSLPYYDPAKIFRHKIISENWTKPVVVVSSQEPELTSIDSSEENAEIIRRIGSDAERNFRIALMLIADGKVGEVGLVTNDLTILKGVYAMKYRETDIPPYTTDPSISPVAEYTALGLRYPNSDILRATVKPAGLQTKPFVIRGIENYMYRVTVVYESSHLNLCRLFLDTNGKVPELESIVRKYLPEALVYIVSGAGNVEAGDYEILKKMYSEGIPIIRVPILGGRIPRQPIYNVPGHDLVGVNMLPEATKYKVQATLSLADHLKIKPNDRKKFVETMVTEPWGLEILPQR